MTPVARALVAVALVAGAGPAGFIMYRLVLGHYHPAEVPPPGQMAPAPPTLNSPHTAAPGTSAPGRLAAPPPGAQPTATTSSPRDLPGRLPDFVLADSAGVPHRPADYRGKPLVLNFWATWCEPCRREIPLLKRLSVQYRPQGLQIVGVAMDFRADVLRYAHDKGIDYPLLMGENNGLALVNALGMDTVFPFTLFVDRSGDIVTVKVGELHADEAALILDRLQEVDSGRLALKTAQQDIDEGMRKLAIARARQSQASTGADTANAATS